MAIFLVLKSRHRLMLGLGVAVMLAVTAAFVPSHWIDRMKTIETYEHDGSALGRLEAWRFAVKLVLDRPIVGGGFRPFVDEELYKNTYRMPRLVGTFIASTSRSWANWVSSVCSFSWD